MAKKKSKGPKNASKKFSVNEYMRTKMRSLPIGKCYVSPNLEESELTVLVTRQHPAGTLTFASFLIDKYCCGVKDAVFGFSIDPYDFQQILDHYDKDMGIQEVTYDEAHNMVYGALEYAESLGIPPHKDFEKAQYVLAEDNDDVPLIEYEFGKDGRPTLMSFSLLEIDYYKKLMLKVLRPDEFDVVYLGAPDDDDWDDEEDDETDLGEDEFKEKTFDAISNVFDHSIEEHNNVINTLDPVRKAAFFMLAGAVIKQWSPMIPCFAQFEQSVAQTLDKFRDKGDADFAQPTALLYDVINWISDPKNRKEIANGGQDALDVIFRLSVVYREYIKELHIRQSDYLRKIINDPEGETLLLKELLSLLKSIIKSLSEVIEASNGNENAPIPFNIVGIRGIVGKWADKSVKTSIPIPKRNFLSKNTETYYKGKVREIVNRRYNDDEDFAGLIIILSNLTSDAYQFVCEDEIASAWYIVKSIVFETVYALFRGFFDEWIADDDARENLKIVLSNAMTIMANMIRGDFVDEDKIRDVYKHSLRFSRQITDKYADIIDFHPIIYATEAFFFSPLPDQTNLFTDQ